LTKLPQLPVYYYLDHFAEMLGFVQRTYEPVLAPDHHAFIARFERLSRDAQCLLVRMINRRGAIFNRSLFNYSEIDDVERAISDLTAAGHARAIGEADYSVFVSCLPKNVLVTGAQAAGRGDVRRSWSKPKFIDYYLEQIPFSTAAQHCGARNFIALAGTQPIEFLLHLYFGKTEVTLKNFALRDLGILRTNRETSFSARFTDAEEALASFHYSQVLDNLEEGSEPVHTRAAIDVLSGPACGTQFAGDLRNRAAHQTGLFFEKAGERSCPTALPGGVFAGLQRALGSPALQYRRSDRSRRTAAPDDR
jgi:DNA polymerase III subunit epsilon